MFRRLLAVAMAALFVVGCGGTGRKEKVGMKAAPAVKPEGGGEEAAQIAQKMEEAAKAAQQSVVKEEVPKPPLETEFYLLTEAFAATGFRWEGLKRKVEEGAVKGQEYVKLTRYNTLPETANIYDDMGNHVYTVSYLWDKTFEVWGSVYKSSNERMLTMFLYCRGQKDLFVHELSTFRVHAPYTRKVTVAEGTVTVEFVDGHDLRGELPAWPECKDLTEAQEKAGPYQTPWGVGRQVFAFDADGNLTSAASFDQKGDLAEDIQGIAKKELAWKDGRKAEEAYFAKDGLIARYVFQYNEKGKVATKAVVNAAGGAALDYFGAASYEYLYDKRGRVLKEIRKNVDGSPLQTHEFDYGKFGQVRIHKVFDAAGTLLTTYEAEFDHKGARTKLSVFEGDPKDGKLKTDANGIAIYRFVYTDKGKLIKETRHAATQVLDKDGKQDYMLANAMDGWAIIENTYDAKTEEIAQTTASKVDAAGNAVYSEMTDAEGTVLFRVERIFVDNKLNTSTKTVLEQGRATRKLFMDAADKVLYVATLQYNSDGLLMEVAYFQADEKTPGLSPEGYHKQVNTYTEDQKPASEGFFDVVGAKVRTRMFEYSPEGQFQAVKVYDASGNLVPAQ